MERFQRFHEHLKVVYKHVYFPEEIIYTFHHFLKQNMLFKKKKKFKYILMNSR